MGVNWKWMGADRSRNSCPTCTCGAPPSSCSKCNSGTTPTKLQVTLGNFLDHAPCTSCASTLNATFVLVMYPTQPLSSATEKPCGAHLDLPNFCNNSWWITAQLGPTVIQGNTFDGVSVQLWSSDALGGWPSVAWRQTESWPIDCNIDIDLPLDSGMTAIMTPLGYGFYNSASLQTCLNNGFWTCHVKALYT